MKKYYLGILSLSLAIGLSAFTKPAKSFTCFVFKYFGPACPTQSQLINRNNWRVRIINPYTQCIPDIEEAPCSFTAVPDASYLSLVDNDMYKPSTKVIIMGKLSIGGDQYVVDYAEDASNSASICFTVENFDPNQ